MQTLYPGSGPISVEPHFALTAPNRAKSSGAGVGNVFVVAGSPISLTKAPNVPAGGDTITIVAGPSPLTRNPCASVPGI